MDPKILYDLACWAVSGETGLSSKFLASCALGIWKTVPVYAPADDGDFKRVMGVMSVLGAERGVQALDVAADSSKEWRIIRDHWAALVRAHNDLTFYTVKKELGL